MVVRANRYLSFLMRSILVLLMCGSEQRQAAVSATFGKRASSLWDLGASNCIEVWQEPRHRSVVPSSLLSPVGFVGNVEGGA